MNSLQKNNNIIIKMEDGFKHFYKIGKKNNNDDSAFYGIYAIHLLKLNIVNWVKNRPPDMTRIPSMIKLLKTILLNY